MPERYDYTLGQGDVGGYIELALKNEDGTPVDLTGSTVKFHMKTAPGASGGINATAAIQSPPTNGIVRYTWLTGDSSVAGLFYAQAEVTFPSSKIQTYPNGRYLTVRVLEQVA